MTLSDISIKNPVFAWGLMLGILVFGALSFTRLGISQMPDVDFPVITVTVTWAGAEPEVMESAVADIIENAVMSVDGIQMVQSISQQGQTQIIIQLALNQNVNTALTEVQTYVSSAQKNLPQTIDPPTITKTNPSLQPIMWTAVYASSSAAAVRPEDLPEEGGDDFAYEEHPSTANVSLRDIAFFVRDHLQNAITTITGVGNVFLGGYVDPQMRIWVDNDKLRKNEITVDDIIAAVNYEHQLTPTGYQRNGSSQSYVNVHSQFRNAAECDELIIPSRQYLGTVWKRIRLGNVARCIEGTDELQRISRFNGVFPTMGVGIIKQPGTNAVRIADAVKKRIKELQRILPGGMNMGLVIDQTQVIRASIAELLRTILYAVLFTSLVCYLFLGSLSSAANVILAIPVSLMGTFIFVYFFGFTLNSFTLMALALSVGIVVDDAIMVLENIVRYNESGMPRVQAAIVGAREITSAAAASSLAILAIFVPVIFMQGIVGKFFLQFALTMSVTVLLSLLEALTLAPMRLSQFITSAHDNLVTRAMDRAMDALSKWYRRALSWCLDRRAWVIASAFGLTFASYGVALLLRKEFVPSQDQSQFLVTLYTKMGSSLSFTDGVFEKAGAFLRSRPEVKHYYEAIGGFGGGLVNQGIMFVVMKEPGDRPAAAPFKSPPSQKEFMQFIRRELGSLPGVKRVAILDFSQAAFSAQRGYPIELEVQGPHWDSLVKYSMRIFDKLKASGMMADLDTDYNPNMPELEIYPDREKAARMSVPVATIAQDISALVAGVKLLPNKYTDSSNHRDDIQVKFLPRQNRNPDDISNIYVRNTAGQVVALRDLVKMKWSKALLTITRYNRERGVGIFGNFAPGKSESDVVDYIKMISDEILPKGQGYHIMFSGSTQAFQESFKGLLFALFFGIFVAYLVLASQFNSFVHPLTILSMLPFSVSGALLALWATNTSLNIYSLIGILLLMGIVKKNSILLVDFTNNRREAGMGLREALLDACPIRLRPILMTSAATMAGAIPEALARGTGSEIIRPMAIAVLGGIALSLTLTLLVVPCVYSVMSRFESTRHRERLHAALEALGELPGTQKP